MEFLECIPKWNLGTRNGSEKNSQFCVGWADEGSPTIVVLQHVGLRASAQPTHLCFFRLYRLFVLLLFCLTFTACNSNNNLLPMTTLSGTTMGTQWHIKFHPLPQQPFNTQQLQQKLENRLTAINQLFSTYQTDSVISRFNRFNSQAAFTVNEEFLTVIKAAQAVSQATQGAFDITAAPLIDLWGFGKDIRFAIPTEAQIAAVKKIVGYQHLRVQTSPPALYKAFPALRIDVSAIAKGYAVDQLALILDQHDIQHYMVDIGGEIKLKGHNNQGKNWQVAIQKPDANAKNKLQNVEQIVSLTQTAIATSGDYRNYFVANGKRYSHTINPQTGKPVQHQLASVTILHQSAMMADAYATAINVLGSEKGMALAEQLQLAIYLLIRDEEEGKFVSKKSVYFP